jgi:hypothetical protein
LGEGWQFLASRRDNRQSGFRERGSNFYRIM